LFKNSYVCFGCFHIGLKHRNKPKQSKFFCLWFHKTNRNTTETDLVSVCFGLTQNFFIYFRGHSNNYTVMKQESKKLQKAEEAEQRAPGSG
jgi:hypothetical protein